MARGEALQPAAWALRNFSIAKPAFGAVQANKHHSIAPQIRQALPIGDLTPQSQKRQGDLVIIAVAFNIAGGHKRNKGEGGEDGF
jgi:hypothetical protein